MPWGELLDTVLGASQRDLVMGWMRSSRGAEHAGLSGMCTAVPRACTGSRKGQAPALSRNKPLQSLKHGQQLRTSPCAVSSTRFRKVLSTLCQHLSITSSEDLKQNPSPQASREHHSPRSPLNPSKVLCSAVQQQHA